MRCRRGNNVLALGERRGVVGCVVVAAAAVLVGAVLGGGENDGVGVRCCRHYSSSFVVVGDSLSTANGASTREEETPASPRSRIVRRRPIPNSSAREPRSGSIQLLTRRRSAPSSRGGRGGGIVLAQRLEQSPGALIAFEGDEEERLVGRRAFLRRSMATAAGCVALPLLLAPPSSLPCRALSPVEAERSYDSYASSYDALDGRSAAVSALGIDGARSDLIKRARGNVLEIGAGTGLNLEYYDPMLVKSITAVDISEGMLEEAQTRMRSLPNLKQIRVRTVKADATSNLVSEFGTEAFDTVVDSFSLCVMGTEGATAALRQMSEVTKTGGKVLLLENSRSTNSILGAYQDLTASGAAAMGGKGCVYNQDVAELIRRAAGGRLVVENEIRYAAGLFRAFVCVRK